MKTQTILYIAALGLLPLSVKAADTDLANPSASTASSKKVATTHRRHSLHQTRTTQAVRSTEPSSAATTRPANTNYHPSDNPPDVWAASSDSFK